MPPSKPADANTQPPELDEEGRGVDYYQGVLAALYAEFRQKPIMDFATFAEIAGPDPGSR